ncbi:MAG: hypothetical protein ACJAX3_002756 [Patiriisocius sp.]
MTKEDVSKSDRLVILNIVISDLGFTLLIRFMARKTMGAYRNGITTNQMLKNLFKSGMKENNLNKQGIEGYNKPLKEEKKECITSLRKPVIPYQYMVPRRKI